VFAGEEEARMLVPKAQSVADMAERISALGPSHVIIKLGKDGAFARVDGQEFSQPGFPVAVVDTVGAGDAFVAGYLAEFLEGRCVEDALETAAMAGAFACMSETDWCGTPTRADLAGFTAKEQVRR
jgi:2-dehydro-3-deoxygluconokinase